MGLWSAISSFVGRGTVQVPQRNEKYSCKLYHRLFDFLEYVQGQQGPVDPTDLILALEVEARR